ncbi:MAG: hypothetical protein US49_C0002G0037 [candidate division TM6 bacterium GW2011_GWF2_37_49]|nr:MAG: hypothetical protein US49_C0002G0037 [candidate division TM6 bacterium GW2011_GWF2_37_49]
MKISKLLGLALIATISVNAANLQATTIVNPEEETSVQTTSQLSKDAKIAKRRCEEAARRILATEPTSWMGDLGRDFASCILSNFIVDKAINSAYAGEIEKLGELNILVSRLMNGTITDTERIALGGYLKIKQYYVVFMIPILRILIDKIIRKKNDIDADLDFLISQKNTNLNGLIAADFNVEGLEAKVLRLSDKAEWFRWIIRLLTMISGTLSAYSCCPSDNQILKIASLVAMAVLCWHVYIKQSATFKKAERLSKIQILNDALIDKITQKHDPVTVIAQ